MRSQLYPNLLVVLAVALSLSCGGEPPDSAAADAGESSWLDDASAEQSDAGSLADASAEDDAAIGADSALPDLADSPDTATADDTSAGPPQLTACGAPAPAELNNLSPEELNADLVDKDFLLINVASASGDQLPQTDAYVPYNDTEALIDYIGPDLDTEVVLYCNSGGRSGVAGNSLVELGYCQISHLAGGKNAWAEAGYEFAQ